MAALLDDRVDACVRHVFAGSGYVLGRFDCPPGAARWATVNWIGDQPHVVVPDTAVRLLPEGGETYVSTVNHVLVYDRDVRFRRQVVSAEGDRCTFAVVTDPLAAELGVDRPRRRPRLRHAASSARDYAVVQAARAALAAGGPDLLAVDEALLAVLHRVAGQVGGTGPLESGRVDAGRSGTERAHREAVEAVKALLAADLPRRWTLAQLGAAVHYSPFRLARVFRARTGYPIAGYLRQLRLRASLPAATAPGADLSTVAAEYGFSSHSHYTRAFRQVFGRTPTEARRRGQVLTT